MLTKIFDRINRICRIGKNLNHVNRYTCFVILNYLKEQKAELINLYFECPGEKTCFFNSGIGLTQANERFLNKYRRSAEKVMKTNSNKIK